MTTEMNFIRLTYIGDAGPVWVNMETIHRVHSRFPQDGSTVVVDGAHLQVSESVDVIMSRLLFGAQLLCCDMHVAAGDCCDANDCGPCCEDCPTCPTLARQRRHQTAEGLSS